LRSQASDKAGDGQGATERTRILDCPVVDASQHNERSLIMMNHANGGMNGWMGGGMWIWAVIGILAAVLLVILITKLLKK
jgi:hypothetical protein